MRVRQDAALKKTNILNFLISLQCYFMYNIATSLLQYFDSFSSLPAGDAFVDQH